jgi:hypothetical protein
MGRHQMRLDILWKFGDIHGVIDSIPFMYGLRQSGMVTEPSACW